MWEFSTVGSFETKSEDNGGRHVDLLDFAFLTVRFTATAFTVGGQFTVPRKLELFKKVQLCWIWSKLVKMTRYDGLGWTLYETPLLLCHKIWQSSEIPLSGTNPYCSSLIHQGPNPFDEQRYHSIVLQKKYGHKVFQFQQTNADVRETENWHTIFPAGFELRLFRS